MPRLAPLQPLLARACHPSMLRSCIAIIVLLLASPHASADVFDGDFQPTLSRYAARPSLRHRQHPNCNDIALNITHSYFEPEYSSSFKLVSRNVFDLECAAPAATLSIA